MDRSPRHPKQPGGLGLSQAVANSFHHAQTQSLLGLGRKRTSIQGFQAPQDGTGSGVYQLCSTPLSIFEPRPVEIGTAYGNRITVARGLAAGDRVVTAANFLIDSESRMRTGALPMASANHDTHVTHDPPGTSLLHHNIHLR